MIINFINGGDTTELEEQLSALTEELTVVEGDYVNLIERSTTDATVPDNTSKIGIYAFKGCKDLTDVVISDSVTSIGSEAFHSCTKLTSVNIPDSVESIGEKCFNDCSGMTSAVLPDGVSAITNSLFDGCRNLETVNIPQGVKDIGSYAFRSCGKLTEITLPDGLTRVRDHAFESCSGLTGTIVIPSGVTKIENDSFKDCKSITSLTFPSTLTQIADRGFQGCSSLNSITCHATTAPTVKNNSFSGVSATGTLYIPSGSTYTSWVSALPTGWTVQAIVLPQVILSTSAGTITETFPNDHIPANQYSGREDIYSITINNMSMGDNICGWCPNLSAATLNGYGEITTTSFCDCTSLSEINITGNYTSIGDYVFRDVAASSMTINVVNLSGTDSVNSPNLLEIELGPNVSFIGSSFFRGSSNVNKIICHATTPPTIEDWALSEFADSGELWVESGDYSSWFGGTQLPSGWTIHYISKFTPLTSITQMAAEGYIFGKQNGASTTAVGVSFDAPTSEALWYNYEGVGVSGLNVNIVYDSNQDKAVYKDANTQQELSAADKAIFEQYFKVTAVKDNDGTTVYLMTEITGTLKDHQTGWATNPICGDFTNWVVYK